METTIKEVKAGAKYLDKNFPKWWTRIDPEILQMASAKHCILGQLYGDYPNGSIVLATPSIKNKKVRLTPSAFLRAESEIETDWRSAYDIADSLAQKRGFFLNYGNDLDVSYEQLNCAWTLEIAKRLSPAWRKRHIRKVPAKK